MKKGPAGPFNSFWKDVTLCGRGVRFGAFGFEAGAGAGALGRGVAIDELDDGPRGIVAVTGARLHDAQVAAVTVGVARGDGVEQALDDAFIADLRDYLAAGVQVAALAERHQLLDDRTQVLRLRQGGDDLLVL